MASNRPPAVVTGASSGIGYEPAKLCAENGYDLVLAADQSDIIDVTTTLAMAGWKNKVQVAMAKVQPAEQTAKQHRKLTEPGYSQRKH